jgi:diguanylate cyclase (GGDEF)-like protein
VFCREHADPVHHVHDHGRARRLVRAHNRQLTGRLRVAEERDFVTGLLNTRAFDAAFSARAELGRPFGLVLADMDSLREINDGEGHAVGNDLLRLAGDILKRELGYGDHIARIGGDEFGIITSAGNRRGPCALQSPDSRAARAQG